MTPPSQRATPAPVKRAPKSASKIAPKSAPKSPPRSAPKRTEAVDPATQPFLRFQLPTKLRDKTLNVLGLVESADDAVAHAGPLIDIVLELTKCGMDQYFLQSLKATKANFLVQQSAALGLAGVQKLMGTVIRNIIGRMDHRQLLSVCKSIRQFMV